MATNTCFILFSDIFHQFKRCIKDLDTTCCHFSANHFHIGPVLQKARVSSFILLLNTVLSLPSEFRYGKAPILIATDVASRGLGEYSTQEHHFVISVTHILKKVVLLSLTFLCIF